MVCRSTSTAEYERMPAATAKKAASVSLDRQVDTLDETSVGSIVMRIDDCRSVGRIVNAVGRSASLAAQIPVYHAHPFWMFPFLPPSSNLSVTTMRCRYFMLL